MTARADRIQFQKVFAINLPSRTDKRDALILSSSVTGIHVDWIDGVTPDEIDAKTYPYVRTYLLIMKMLMLMDRIGIMTTSRTNMLHGGLM